MERNLIRNYFTALEQHSKITIAALVKRLFAALETIFRRLVAVHGLDEVFGVGRSSINNALLAAIADESKR